MDSPMDHKVLTSNELSELRTGLSGERTLMSWIRTALGLISFGFSIHKFMAALPGNKSESPRRLGIVLTAMGTVALAAGTIQYLRTLRELEGARPGFTFYFACVGIGLGVLLFAGMALRMGPFN
ncbi:MAG TPA: DUF202 domain-containing protein [Polyangia bacterium]|nr:DUF202 domain-containing protein [Polyangia bacterium]